MRKGVSPSLTLRPKRERILLTSMPRGEVVGTSGGRGFVRNPDGDITLFDVPNALMTLGVCINARGEIAGNFVDGQFNFYSYVRDHKGNIVVFHASGEWPTYVAAINDSGEIAGSFYDAGRLRGYLRDRSGSLTVLDFDMAGNTLNNRGDLAGVYSQGGKIRGFVRTREGDITIFDAPDASATFVSAINDGGEVAGSFGDTTQANKTRGFVRDIDGDVTVFDVPNAWSTVPASINDRGDVAGYFRETTQSSNRGFVFRRNEKASE